MYRYKRKFKENKHTNKWNIVNYYTNKTRFPNQQQLENMHHIFLRKIVNYESVIPVSYAPPINKTHIYCTLKEK